MVDSLLRKSCSRCGEAKDIEAFPQSRGRANRRSDCKECHRKVVAARRAANPASVKEASRRAYVKHADKIRKRSLEWRWANIDLVRKYEAEHKAEASERSRRFYEKNKADHNKRSAEWQQANREQYRAINRRSKLKKLATIRGRLENGLRRNVARGLKTGAKLGRRTIEILGFDLDKLMHHIARQFTAGMSWDNYGYGKGRWHIDHIIPLAAFNYETPDDEGFKAAWHITNLRPLWHEQNIAKGAKIETLL